jgi:hypothetical protein
LPVITGLKPGVNEMVLLIYARFNRMKKLSTEKIKSALAALPGWQQQTAKG